MLNRVGDVEKAQGCLKEANNRNAALARENDALRAENDRLRLRVPRPVQGLGGDDMPPAKARSKHGDGPSAP